MTDFPLVIEEPVYYCGYNSPKSYGGNSYFIRRAEGNWLIDSPNFVTPLVQRLEALGRIAHIFLTHRGSWLQDFLPSLHQATRRVTASSFFRSDFSSPATTSPGAGTSSNLRHSRFFAGIPGPGRLSRWHIWLTAVSSGFCRAWQTTYIHVLTGENPVLEWFKGTALRPLDLPHTFTPLVTSRKSLFVTHLHYARRDLNPQPMVPKTIALSRRASSTSVAGLGRHANHRRRAGLPQGPEPLAEPVP